VLLQSFLSINSSQQPRHSGSASQNWRGKPLISYLVIVQLIASTTTDTGLTVACRLDDSDYAKGIKVTDAEMAALNIQPADFHGEWNYTIAPRLPEG
jgi:Rhodopirellula transposase DDE domain